MNATDMYSVVVQHRRKRVPSSSFNNNLDRHISTTGYVSEQKVENCFEKKGKHAITKVKAHGIKSYYYRAFY